MKFWVILWYYMIILLDYTMCREIEIMWYFEDYSVRDCEREISIFIKRDEKKVLL